MPLPKGRTNNPNGRPRTGEAFVEQLRIALETVAKKKGKTLIQHAVERAYEDDMVLTALLKKILPDQLQHSGDIGISIKFDKQDEGL